MKNEKDKIKKRISLPFNKRTLYHYELILTENCNFRCKYCFDDSFSSREKCSYNYTMSTDKIPDIINFIESTKCQDTPPRVSFFGGEPTLNWEFIEGFIKSAEERNLYYSYSMNTNLSLLTPSRVDFLIEKKFNLICSIDGIEEAHNSTRVFQGGMGTWQHIMKNLPCALGKFRNARLPFTAMMVVDNRNYTHLQESYLFLRSLGFTEVNILWNYECPYTEEDYLNIKSLLIDLFVTKRAEPYLDLKRNILSPQKAKSPYYCQCVHNCVTINPLGQLFFCHRLTPKMCDALLDDSYPEMFGNIYSGYTNKEYLKFIEKRTHFFKNKDPECMKCVARDFCKGGCIGAIRDNTPGYDHLPSLCRIERILAELKEAILQKDQINEGSLK